MKPNTKTTKTFLKQEIADRQRAAIAAFMKIKKIESVNEWCNEAGITEGALRNFLKGDNDSMNSNSLELLARAQGVSIGELLGETPKLVVSDSASKNLTLIQRSTSITASAGKGVALNDDYVRETVAFKTDWLRRLTRAKPEQLVVISVTGESMMPTLADGDHMLIDTTQKAPTRNGIYVFDYKGDVLVKRISVDPIKKRVTLRSDNPAFSDVEVYSDDEVEVSGQVIWIGRKV